MNITSYAQNFEDVMLWRALGHIERGLYIDVGAQDPVIDSVSLAFHEHGWQGIHVEPTPHYAALLRQKRPGDKVIQAAVGSDSAVLHFFEILDTGISTADAEIAAQHRARGFDVRETNVPCIPLSAVFQLCAEQEIHWLKIDVEGFEQQVLSSWGTSTARPWVVVVESTLPLTQIDTHQSWESILVGYGYTSVYFDGLNRYYVSETHSELKAAFAAPPNVFDGFALNGTASAPFHQLIAARYQEKISEAEKQLAALALSHSEQERTMQEHQAEREQALQQKLQALQAQLDRLQQERAARETLLHAQNSQSRQELERLLRQLVEREQEVAAQLLQTQQQAEREKTELAHRHAEHATALQQQYAELEQALQQKLQALEEQLDRLQQERAARETLLHEQNSHSRLELERLLRQLVQREQQVAAQLLQTQQQAEREKTELAHRHAEHATALQQQYAEREQALQQKLQALQEQLLQAQQHAEQQRTELSHMHSEQEREMRDEFTLKTLSWMEEKKANEQVQLALREEFREKEQELIEVINRQREFQESFINSQRQLEELRDDFKLKEIFIKNKYEIKIKAIQEELNKVNSDIFSLEYRHVQQVNFFVNELQRLKSRNSNLNRIKRESLLEVLGLMSSNFSEVVTHQTIELISSTANVNFWKHEHLMDLPMYAKNNYQPTFELNQSGVYHVNDFLKLYDRNFVKAAYQAILNRDPDAEGEDHYVSKVRSGVSKLYIIENILKSPEAGSRKIRICGFRSQLIFLKICDFPIVGNFMSGVIFFLGIKSYLKDLRAMENHIVRVAEETQALHEFNIKKLENLINK
ncbi:FkbM family methyltransferase [Comamonas sp. Z1]|uniref:FkbM family methyltransferase n=1 Tax=Comamonas sp. Z1 TaxID=2601246 RepID=UPI001652B966|nr:FkbM family methyltransferase [Comamonas sp. Z1]